MNGEREVSAATYSFYRHVQRKSCSLARSIQVYQSQSITKPYDGKFEPAIVATDLTDSVLHNCPHLIVNGTRDPRDATSTSQTS